MINLSKENNRYISLRSGRWCPTPLSVSPASIAWQDSDVPRKNPFSYSRKINGNSVVLLFADWYVHALPGELVVNVSVKIFSSDGDGSFAQIRFCGCRLDDGTSKTRWIRRFGQSNYLSYRENTAQIFIGDEKKVVPR